MAIIASQPKGSNLKEEDIKIMTNMILSVLSRNKVIEKREALDMQFAIKDRVARLEYYSRMWGLLKKVDPTRWVAQALQNREGEK